VVALAWTYLGGSTGVAARVTGRDLFSAWTYTLPGAIFVLSVVLFPLSMLAAEVAVRRVDSRLEEAALLVAPAGRVLRRITLPLAAPPIWAAGLIIFVLAISEFGVPALLRVRVFTTEVFTAFAALYDFRRATVLTIPLLVLSAIVAIAAARILGERLVTTRRGSRNAQTIRLDAWKGRASTGAAVVVALTVVLPMLVLLAESLASGPDVGPLRGSLDAITNSLILAAVSACAVVGVAFWIGYARARFAPPRAGRFVDALLLALFAAPSTIVGIGLIGVWNRSGPAGALYGTDAMLVIASVARFVPVAALVIGASVRQLPVSHEEAAAVSGAGWLRTIRRIVLPQVALGLLAAWIVTFILTFGELGASILVAPPGESTLPIRVYTLIANAPSSHVAALALLQAGVVICPLVILAFALGRREAR
jgi:iron(III) transport system permease protein